MVNQVEIKWVGGEAVALHLTGVRNRGIAVKETIPLYAAVLGELTDGEATLELPAVYRGELFTFPPKPHDDDPVGETGRVNYDIIAGHLEHTTQGHHEPAPVIDDPLMARIALLEAKLNAPVKVFDELKLEVYKENGKVIGHEWRLEMADNSDTGFAANAHVHGILPQKTGLPIVYIQYFDLQRNITAEVRARCATNHYAGFRYLLNGSAVSDQLYTGAEAETLLNLADQ